MRTCRCAWAFYIIASEAVVSMTGMSVIFKLCGADVYEVLKIAKAPWVELDAGATLAACMRSAPIADINYIDAFTIGASDVRDDEPLLQ